MTEPGPAMTDREWKKPTLSKSHSAAEFYREMDRLEQAVGIRLPLPRDVEGRPMVHARSDDGQAEGRVDGRIEGQHLQRDVPLVVVHADERVPAPPPGREEGGIR